MKDRRNFRYKVFHLTRIEEIEEKLNQLGAEGWELFLVSDYHFYLRRELK